MNNEEVLKELKIIKKQLNAVIKIMLINTDKSKLCKHLRLNKKRVQFYFTSQGDFIVMPCLDCGAFVVMKKKKKNEL